MPQLQQLLEQIDQLDPVEREQLMSTLSEGIPFHRFFPAWWPMRSVAEFPSITTTPGVCGGAARIIRTRIPVWVIERMRQLGVAEADILRSYPALRAVDLVQAWSYAARHPDEIEKAICENEEE